MPTGKPLPQSPSASEAPSPRFTILTPTFNRAHTLPRAFESLKALLHRDFEWLIVDDGSTDATREIADQFREEADFPVRYEYRENGHKKAALNTGFALARGKLTIILDSDDTLTPDALGIFARAWDSIDTANQDRFCGVRALCIDDAGDIVGDDFPTDPFDASTNEILYRYRITGEKLSCDRTDLLRQFRFPEDVKGLVPEQVLWSTLAKNHVYRCVNQPVRQYFNSNDSLSGKLASADYGADLEGLCYAYSFVLDNEWDWFFVNPKILIKAAGNRKRFLQHLSRQNNARNFPLSTMGGKMIATMFGWLGYMLYWRDSIRCRRLQS
ncbi:glycosyltransferase family A protein [uncultured Sphingomonas sp.]|uniref:glycosyltransferase family 2 protein n=1 Tax=uncultured Sphingomonas sp. TaxID=158754 RepID=UPI0025E3A462|nr:glycosyltransferase family A protein [uncultured Sphingomonas sp.]